jgi:hypothetical protein
MAARKVKDNVHDLSAVLSYASKGLERRSAGTSDWKFIAELAARQLA